MGNICFLLVSGNLFIMLFFDNDILYDGECAGVAEVQNDIEPRIQENTPRLRTQYSFTSRETDFAQYYETRNRDGSLSELERL